MTTNNILTRKRRRGNLVLRMPPIGPKLWNEWEGPYYITKVINDTTYDLAMPDHPRKKVRQHINLLKEFNSPVACLTSSELMYDITLQREEEDEAMPAVHKRISTDKKKLLLDVVRKFDKFVGQGQMDYTHIVIETGDSYPKNQPPCRMDQRKTVILNEEVKTATSWNNQTIKKARGQPWSFWSSKRTEATGCAWTIDA